MIGWSNVAYKCTAKNAMIEIMLGAYLSIFSLSGSHLVQVNIHSNVKGLIDAAERNNHHYSPFCKIYLLHRKIAVEILSCQTNAYQCR